jgi:hypothetical protein
MLTSKNDDGGTSTSLSPNRELTVGAGSTRREGEDARRYLYTVGRVQVVATTPRFPVLRDSGAGFRALSAPLLFSSRLDRDEGKPVIRDPQGNDDRPDACVTGAVGVRAGMLRDRPHT